MVPAAVLLAILAVPPPADPGRPRLHVSMRVEDGVPLSEEDSAALADDVRHIWASVVDVIVSVPADARPLPATDAIRLDVTSRTLAGGDSSGLAWIAFVNGEPEPAITVSLTAARQLLQQGSWRGMPFSSLPPVVSRTFVRRTLARAAAHEIGHYLLRSKEHARRGLMRPVYSVDEIMDGRASLVQLSRADAERLRASRILVARLDDLAAAPGEPSRAVSSPPAAEADPRRHE